MVAAVLYKGSACPPLSRSIPSFCCVAMCFMGSNEGVRAGGDGSVESYLAPPRHPSLSLSLSA